MAITKIKSSNITDGTIVDADIAGMAASKLTGALPAISGASLTGISTDTSRLEYNQSILAFKLAAQNSLARFQMVDQVIDEYQDATGVDAGNSTNERAAGSGIAKYYDGTTTGSVTPTVTGGTTTVVGDYTYHAFTSGTVNYVTNTTQDLDILVVAGGGGAGTAEGGGGGAGGLIYQTGRSVANGTYAVTVGTGGTSGTSGSPNPGTSGTDSTFGSIFTAKGGGRGGHYSTRNGEDGGSGGGGGHSVSPYTAWSATQSAQPGDSGTYGFGYDGGNAYPGGGNANGSGGGGGAGGQAPDYGQTNGATNDASPGGGYGGVGKEIALFNRWGTTSANVATSGTDGGWFAGGGAGGRYNCANNGLGGKGGGGNGGCGPSTSFSTAIANTGGGGGGGGALNGPGATGIVLIRRETTIDQITSGGNLTLQSVATTAESVPTKADLVVLIEDGSGTATVNTDVKGYISRNGSAFSTAVTFVDEGDWGTNKRILVARQVDISGITSGTSMKYKLTTHNQSAGSKETRIHATSLAWS